jgi:predicted  nucleic acid-binding Zn-ribbon protein
MSNPMFDDMPEAYIDYEALCGHLEDKITVLERRVKQLQDDGDTLRSDALWAATHRSELTDLRDAFVKEEDEIVRLKDSRDALLKALKGINERVETYFGWQAAEMPEYETACAAIKQAESHQPKEGR